MMLFYLLFKKSKLKTLPKWLQLTTEKLKKVTIINKVITNADERDHQERNPVLTSSAKYHTIRLQLPAVKLSQVICSFLVKPNRMFGLVEASAWMHVRNGTIKMSGLLGSESDPVTVFLLTFSAVQKK